MNYDFTKYEKLIQSLYKLDTTKYATINSNLSYALESMISHLTDSATFNISGLNAALRAITPSLTYVQNYSKNLENILSQVSSISSSYSGKTFNALVKQLSTNMKTWNTYADSDYISDLLIVRDQILESVNESPIEIDDIDEDFIDLPEPLADVVKQLDETIDLPEADDKNIVHIKKTNPITFEKVCKFLSWLIPLLITIYLSYSSGKLDAQQHSENIQQSQQQHKEQILEEHKQTQELKKQTAEEIKQTKLLQEIEEKLSSNNKESSIQSSTSKSQ